MKTGVTGYLEIVGAKYASGYKVLLTFSDGVERVVDFGPFLSQARNPDSTDYRDLKKFKTFRVEDGDLVWGDYQMIFPVMDLYIGTLLKTTGNRPLTWEAEAAAAPAKSLALKDAKSKRSAGVTNSKVSYGKPGPGLAKLKKGLPHV